MKKITIDPITRLEGHGKIEIFLNDDGNVEDAYLQIPELRGFEKFCEGRRAELMPQITSRICGVCPVAHHMASTKALDMAFHTEPTETAKKLRELMYCGYIIYDHILHFYFLGGPDFIVGPTAPKEKRNIFGVIEKVGEELGREVIKHRAYGQRITEIIGGKATHPVCGMPGGVTKAINEEERQRIENMLESCVEFAQKSLEIFKEIVLKNDEYLKLIKENKQYVYNMGLVDDKNRLNFYDGKVRVTSPDGEEFVKFPPEKYLEVIEEKILSWSYVKFPYLKKVGWKGFVDGRDSGIYRVGPLGRLNVSEGMATPLANAEFQEFYDFAGERPASQVLLYHWARLIEVLYAAERGMELVKDRGITSQNIRNPIIKVGGEGIGIVEAARGTLIHHYWVDEEGLIKKVNLIVATTNNNASINLAIKRASKNYIKGGEISEGLLNTIEMFYRAYDPCMACASHASLGTPPIEIIVHYKDGRVRRLRNT